MLRAIFDEPKRKDSGLILAANRAITEYCGELRKFCNIDSEECRKYYRLELWASGFYDALNELEQSKYCSEQYVKRVQKSTEEEMDDEELTHYRLHVYYYKNAFIRAFSILDKLGHFMNDFFELRTEKVKPVFSYFTVLRQMHKLNLHKELEQKLFNLKVKYQLPLNHLRNKRNLEIHSVNVEMIDDLMRANYAFLDRNKIENLQADMADLEQGYEMVCRSLQTVFTYGVKIINNPSRNPQK